MANGYGNPSPDQVQPPPQPMFGNFGQGLQGMFGGLKRGYQAGNRALHPYSNRLMLAGMGLLSGRDGMANAMKGLVAGSALDTEDADRTKLNKALQELQNDPNNTLFAGMSQPEIDIISGDKDTLGAFVANRTKPASTPNSWDEYTLTTDAPTAAGYSKFLKTRPSGTQITMSPSKWSDISGMRNDWAKGEGVSKYQKTYPQLSSMAGAVYDTQSTSDFDFIYGMAQIFDPNSSVRESEQGMVINSQSIPAAIKQQVQRLTVAGGPGLGTDIRRQLVETVGRRVGEYRKQAMRETEYFRKMAERNGLNPDDVTMDLAPLPTVGAPPDDGLTVTPAQ